MKEYLNKKELMELIGGTVDDNNNASLEKIKNVNNVSNCACYYNNKSVTINTNSPDTQCSCICNK